MTMFIHELIEHSALRYGDKPALIIKDNSISYQQLAESIEQIANGFNFIGTQRLSRIGVYLHKTIEGVSATFAASKIGAIFVPINPILKASQVSHIINDCDIEVLVTSKARFNQLSAELNNFPSLTSVILIDEEEQTRLQHKHLTIFSWSHLLTLQNPASVTSPSNSYDTAAIFYTSGSTGKPKGVVLSQLNIVLGAQSVASYLNNTEQDNILALLPLSFDYGFSQLTTSFLVGATCILLDYLLPKDVLRAIERYKVTGLAAVPPLWSQLCKLEWQKYNVSSIRYFTNSGGALSSANLSNLRKKLPQAEPFLMYGLTEAFRSTYLPPSEIDQRTNSIGKAIPNSEILVIDKNGRECEAHQPGELVHIGPLVSQGYWNSPEKTAARFKPAPNSARGVVNNHIAVWSGDTVVKDECGYLYFVSREDEMIKTSGYRVSPSEIEEVLYQYEHIVEAAVVGIDDEDLGQSILVVMSTNSAISEVQIKTEIISFLRKNLPAYMVAKEIVIMSDLPHNANGKIDRSQLNRTYKSYLLEMNKS